MGSVIMGQLMGQAKNYHGANKKIKKFNSINKNFLKIISNSLKLNDNNIFLQY